MSTISRPGGSATDGQTITAAYYNNDLDTIYNDHNGGITNANIASNAAIADSKVNFTGSANTYPKANGSGGVTWSTITTNNGFGFLVKGTVTVADEQSMKWPVPATMTVTNVWAKTTSGSCTLRIQKDTTDVVNSINVTSTLSNTTSLSSAGLTSGQLLTADVTAVSSAVDLFVLVWVTTG